MPSQQHETLIEMFRGRPELVAELLSGSPRVTVPKFSKALVAAGDFTDVSPTEYRADAVVTLEDDDGPVLAAVLEVQLKKDARKRGSWPVYVTTLHARLRCPVALLVICPEQRVADWSATPIEIGPPNSVVTPLAFGPAQVPVITDLDTAQRVPELAVLSALAHGGRSNPVPVFKAFVAALDVLDQDHAALYTDLVVAVLPVAARIHLEELMTTLSHRRPMSEYFRRHYDEGAAQAKTEAVLAVLEARGVTLSDDVRAEITACTDLDRITTWISRSATADTIADVDDAFVS